MGEGSLEGRKSRVICGGGGEGREGAGSEDEHIRGRDRVNSGGENKGKMWM